MDVQIIEIARSLKTILFVIDCDFFISTMSFLYLIHILSITAWQYPREVQDPIKLIAINITTIKDHL
jgi:hypothetical protein